MDLLIYLFLDYLIQKYNEKVTVLELLELFIKS